MQFNRNGESLSVAVIGGSCFLGIANALPAIGAEGAFVADVASELTALHPTPNVLSVTLAQNHTTATLIREAGRLNPQRFHELEETMLRMAPADLVSGLGQCATLGSMAWSVASLTKGLPDRAYNDLLVPLWSARNGVLPHVRLNYMSTLAGGAGCRTSGPMADFLAGIVHQKIGSVVNVSGLLAGGMSFLGMGERIFLNAAIGLAEQVAYTLDSAGRHPLEVRSLGLMELPAASSGGGRIGNNRVLRSALASTMAAAWFSSGAQARIQELRPNREFGRPYGSVAVLRPAWYGLSSPEEIGALAARHYRALCQRLLQGVSAAAPALTVEFSLPAKRPRAIEWVEKARQANGRKPPLWDDGLTASPVFTGRVLVDGREIEDVLPATLSMTKLAAFEAQGALQRGLEAVLESEAEAAHGQAAALRPRVEGLRGALLSASSALFDRSWDKQIKAYLMGSAPTVRAFELAFDAFHEVQAELARADLHEQLCEAALRGARAAGGAYRQFVQRLDSTLQSLSGGIDPQLAAGIEFLPLARVFAELAESVRRGNVAGLRGFLPSTASVLTLDGLARLVGADPNAESIARRFLDKADYESPHWGGQAQRCDPVLRLVVLPPVADAVRREVAEEMVRCGARAELAAADSLAAGASAVALDVYEVEDAADLFPRPYRAALDQIQNGAGEMYSLSPRAREFVDSMARRDPLQEVA